MKISVVYVKKAQTTESEILGNSMWHTMMMMIIMIKIIYYFAFPFLS